MNSANLSRLSWGVLLAYAAWTLWEGLNQPLPLPPAVSAGIGVLFIFSIALTNGLARYSGRHFAVFFLITFVVSNFYENLSILTGFPFGNYHYSDALGLKLFWVPLIIGPSYFATGYLSWSLAHVLLGVFGKKLRSDAVWTVPLIAAFIMVMWDLQMDPIAATIAQKWIWHEGGAYFGVPFVNFLGWLLCVYTIFQLFALYIARQEVKSDRHSEDVTESAHWYQSAIAYFVVSLSWMLTGWSGQNSEVMDPTHKVWQSGDIYASMALVSVFTMWFVVILSVLRIKSQYSAHQRDRQELGDNS